MTDDLGHTGNAIVDRAPEVVGRPMDHKLQPKKKDRPVPARQNNGYYADHTSGDRLRSVTTILNGGVPKESLIFWAANTCTDAAIDALPQLLAASRDLQRLQELRDWIKRAHTRKKDERAELGSIVHKVIECRILGIALPEAIEVGDGKDKKLVRLDDPEIAPYLATYLRFVDEWGVQFTASEMVVANYSAGYAGTLDYTIADGPIAQALRDMGFDAEPGLDLMGDTKTGGTVGKILQWSGHVHGVYPEAGLQMSAYRKGEVCWLRDGSKVQMPKTAGTGVVLHLGADDYDIYPARCGDDVFAYFRHAQVIDEWSSRISSAKADRPVIGKALALPAAKKAVA